MSQGYLHTLGTIALVWCFIGACLWVVMDGLGVTARTARNRRADGRGMTGLHGGTLLAIVFWPLVMREILRNPKEAGAWLWKNLWGRP